MMEDADLVDLQAGIMGLSAQWPWAREYLISQLKTSGPYNATAFEAVLNMSAAVETPAFAFQNISEYFINGFDSIFNSSLTTLTNSDGLMGYHGTPQMPIYAYKAIADMQSPINDTDALIDRYCNVGANILYQRNTIGGHAADYVNGRPLAIKFLQAVLGGTYAQEFPTTGCSIEDVTINITSTWM
jgi:hypothetical protein